MTSEENLGIVVVERTLFGSALAEVLDLDPHITVTGRLAWDEDVEASVAALEPDIVLVAADVLSAEHLLRVCRCLSPLECAVLPVGSPPTPTLLRDVLQADADGYVTLSAGIGELRLALRRVRAGDLVISPELMRPLVRLLLDHGASAAPINTLTAREHQVLTFLAQGHDHRVIAQRLTISPHTARGHVQRVMTKLGAHTREEVVALARQRGAHS